METLFIPHETDLELIQYYARLLTKGIVKKSIQPMLYMIAIHHINGFLFDQTRTEQIQVQRTMMKNFQEVPIDEKVCETKEVIIYEFSLDVIRRDCSL